jgi:hypothetical protein
VVPLANKPWGQPVRKGQDQEEEGMGPRVAEIWVSTMVPPQGSLTRHLHSHASSQAYAGFPY